MKSKPRRSGLRQGVLLVVGVLMANSVLGVERKTGSSQSPLSWQSVEAKTVIDRSAALAGLRIVDKLGVERIWEHVRGLSRQLLDGLEESGFEVLTPTGDEERGGIVAIRVQDAVAFNEALAAEGILAGQYLPGQIRMDVALFHNEEDIKQTLRAVRVVASRIGTP